MGVIRVEFQGWKKCQKFFFKFLYFSDGKQKSNISYHHKTYKNSDNQKIRWKMSVYSKTSCVIIKRSNSNSNTFIFLLSTWVMAIASEYGEAQLIKGRTTLCLQISNNIYHTRTLSLVLRWLIISSPLDSFSIWLLIVEKIIKNLWVRRGWTKCKNIH